MNSADRLLATLPLFTVERPRWTAQEAAKTIGVSLPTAYRYFRSLTKVGLLEISTNGTYMLGPAIIEYDRRIRLVDPLLKIGQPIIRRWLSQTDWNGVAVLCRFYRNHVMCIHQELRECDNVSSYERGRPMPLFCGAPGKIIFANLPSRVARVYFNKHLHDIHSSGLGEDWKTVRASLRRLRKVGVCVAHGEVDKGIVGLAGAIFGENNAVLGALSVALPEEKATPQHIARVSTLVLAASREISAGLATPLSEELLSTVSF